MSTGFVCQSFYCFEMESLRDSEIQEIITQNESEDEDNTDFVDDLESRDDSEPDLEIDNGLDGVQYCLNDIAPHLDDVQPPF